MSTGRRSQAVVRAGILLVGICGGALAAATLLDRCFEDKRRVLVVLAGPASQTEGQLRVVARQILAGQFAIRSAESLAFLDVQYMSQGAEVSQESYPEQLEWASFRFLDQSTGQKYFVRLERRDENVFQAKCNPSK